LIHSAYPGKVVIAVIEEVRKTSPCFPYASDLACIIFKYAIFISFPANNTSWVSLATLAAYMPINTYIPSLVLAIKICTFSYQKVANLPCRTSSMDLKKPYEIIFMCH